MQLDSFQPSTDKPQPGKMTTGYPDEISPRTKQARSRVESKVELYEIKTSNYGAQYEPTEKIRTVIVPSFPDLGRLSAWRFVEWVQANPEGVCSLPTGRTPEFFIKFVGKIIDEWDSPWIQEELHMYGLENRKPVMSELKFVQIDEFYPISADQANSFHSYVQKYYIDGFGMKQENCLVMDLANVGIPEGKSYKDVWPDGVHLELRERAPKTDLERLQVQVLRALDQWCDAYESKIRALGGIGFFMGGIGPDGHLAFNCRGASHHGTTVLC